MIVIAQEESGRSRPTAHAHFIAMLPQIERRASLAFRGVAPEAREELVNEVIANAYVAFVGLKQVGKENVAYPSPLARYAIRQVRFGRRVGNPMNVRDVMSPRAHFFSKIRLERLDSFDPARGQWKEALVEDRHAGPAETAAVRLDVNTWLRALPSRNRKVAEALAAGESTKGAAKKFKVSAARVSQVRRELESSWQQFQGEGKAPAGTNARTSFSPRFHEVPVADARALPTE